MTPFTTTAGDGTTPVVARRASVAQAIVCAGCTETPYRRAGAGAPVLLLAESDATADPLLAALATRFRVFAPTLPATDAGGSAPPFADWLRDFLDCLGLGTVSVVAEGAFAAPLLHFAAADGGRLDRLVLLGDAPVVSWPPAQRDRLLVLPAPGPPTDVLRFLEVG